MSDRAENVQFQVFTHWDGQKERPHVALGRHWKDGVRHITALAIRTRRRPLEAELPGWVPVPARTAGLRNNSVVTFALATFPVRSLEHNALPRAYIDPIVDNVRVLLGLPPKRRPDGPTFIQYLYPPSLRTAGGGAPREIFTLLEKTNWSPLRAGKVYRDHGWHPAFNARDTFFLVVSVNEFQERSPFPLTWVVPVILTEANGSGWGRLRLDIVQRSFAEGLALFADPSRVHSFEAGQQWFLPCEECRIAFGDAQNWRMADSTGSVTCVRCDGAKAEWPEEVATVTGRSLTNVRTEVAAYLGVD